MNDSHPVRENQAHNKSAVWCRRRHTGGRSRRGSILIMALFILVVCLAAAAFAIDVAYMQLVQTQLRSATDAATRAGAQALTQGKSLNEARDAAKSTARRNYVAGDKFILNDKDIVFGIAAENPENPGGRYLFTENPNVVNAVQVRGERTAASESGAVPLFFGSRLFGTGPFEPIKSAVAMIADRDIVVVVDRTTSMRTEDGGRMPSSLQSAYGTDPTYDDDGDGKMRRIEALKVAVNEFRLLVDRLPGAEQLALVSYSKTGETESPLSRDFTEFAQKIYEMPLKYGTNIGAGIDAGMVALQDPSRGRRSATPVMIVMTDGQHNRERDPEDAARDAMAAMPRLTIHTITFSDDAEKKRMQAVAAIGKGRHVHAADVSELVDKFSDLAVSAGVSFIE